MIDDKEEVNFEINYIVLIGLIYYMTGYMSIKFYNNIIFIYFCLIIILYDYNIIVSLIIIKVFNIYI